LERPDKLSKADSVQRQEREEIVEVQLTVASLDSGEPRHRDS
jgi:hypothetical protein